MMPKSALQRTARLRSFFPKKVIDKFLQEGV